jgi:predicted small lipoprotein YifL
MIRAAVPIACLLLAACGQRGGLYIPEESRPTAVPATPAATTGDEADTTEEQRRRQQQAAPANNATGN